MSGTRPLALVTGGCRRLGAAIAARLAAGGYDLALHGGPESQPDATSLAALARAGARVEHVVADLADPVATVALVGEVAGRFARPPALLVNNAARFGEDGPDTATPESLLGHYAVNCVAPLLLARAVAAQAAAGHPAAIVNILDQRIAAPHADQLSYTLSKLALAELTMILARHYAPHVRVCGVAPGLTLPTAAYDEASLARSAVRMPLARLPDPDEIADAVAYLAAAKAVTGQVIYVDSGAHLCRYPRDFPYLD